MRDIHEHIQFTERRSRIHCKDQQNKEKLLGKCKSPRFVLLPAGLALELKDRSEVMQLRPAPFLINSLRRAFPGPVNFQHTPGLSPERDLICGAGAACRALHPSLTMAMKHFSHAPLLMQNHFMTCAWRKILYNLKGREVKAKSKQRFCLNTNDQGV